MPKKPIEQQAVKIAKVNLGHQIAECRYERNLSQSQLSLKIGLYRSNMKYIEDGVNAPTAEVYEKIIEALEPNPQTRARMDALYMTIRDVPPPDVCKTILENRVLIECIRMLEQRTLTQSECEELLKCFSLFRVN